MPTKDKKQTFFIHARPLKKGEFSDGFGNLQYSATRGATFAIRYVNRLVGFKVAVAQCGRKDNFNRKLGRQIAENRLNSVGWWQAKGLSSVLNDIADLCSKQGYVVPVKSLVYFEETFDGKDRKSRR